MRFQVDPWDPAYGTAAEADEAAEGPDDVRLDTEMPAAAWHARSPRVSELPDSVLFVDGVRRIEARVWVAGAEGDEPALGVCASWAAGVARCERDRAEVVAVEVGRGVFAPVAHLEPIDTRHGPYRAVVTAGSQAEQLWLAVQDQMALSERRVSEAAASAGGGHGLVVVDGPLRGREHLAHTVGMVKTHRVRYLVNGAAAVLGTLGPGQRTPVFTILGRFARHSWYVRLPGPPTLSPLGAVVRCECPVEVAGDELVELADLTAHLLGRFASEPHKDPRAPQNLYPIGQLERVLRHRMGDTLLLHRALTVAAARAPGG